MINVTNATKIEYQKDSVAKYVTITFPNADVIYTNSDIKLESLQLDSAINTESSLMFTGCIASMFKFTCAVPTQDLRGQYLEVTIRADETEIIDLFKGYVQSQTNLSQTDVLTEITAYDALYGLNDIDVYSWYDNLLFPITVKDFRDSLFEELGIIQEVTALSNDELTLTKTIKTSTINALDMLKWICQANGRFGRIGSDGVFHYTQLQPINQNADITLTTSQYRKVEYEPYQVHGITYLKLIDSVGHVKDYGTDETNIFCMVDNPIAYGLPDAALQNIYNAVTGLSYISAEIDCQGLPYMEVGDIVAVETATSTITTYILSRTLKGIHNLTDAYIGNGDEYQTLYKETAASRNLAQEITSRIEGDEENRAQLLVERNRITAEVERATAAEGTLSTTLAITADGLQVQINELYSELDGETQLYYTQKVPTLLNYPAWDFTYNIPCNDTVQLRDDLKFEYTDEYYRKNLRAIVYDETNNMTYRFVKSNGVYYWDEVSDTETSLILSRLTTLEATTEGIQTEVSQVEANISNNYYTITQTDSKFTQTNNAIATEVQRATQAENSKIAKTNAIQSVSDILADSQAKADAAATSAKNASIAKTSVYQSADAIVQAAVATAGTNADNAYIAKTTSYQTADAIVNEAVSQSAISAGNNYIAKTSTYQTADSIRFTAEQNANNYTNNNAYTIKSGIAITANGIEISGGKYVKIKSGGTFSVDSGNFAIDSNGNVRVRGAITATSGSFNGTVTTNNITATGGTIGCFIINADGFTYNDLGHTYSVLRNTSELAWSLGDKDVAMTVRGSTVNITAGGTINIGTSATQAVKVKNRTVAWRQLRAVDPSEYILVED